MLQEFAQSPSEAGTQPPKDPTVAAHSLVCSSDIYGSDSVLGAVLITVYCSVDSEPVHHFLFLPSVLGPGHSHLSLGDRSSVQLSPSVILPLSSQSRRSKSNLITLLC